MCMRIRLHLNESDVLLCIDGEVESDMALARWQRQKAHLS